LCAADAPPPDLAAAFGARESLADISLSPDGQTLAFIVPAKGQGAVLYTLGTAPGSVQKAALSVSGDPDRLHHCHWVSNSRLVCTVYGVVLGSDQGVDTVYPFSRIVAVDAVGGNVKMLSARENMYSHGVALGGGSVIDWLPEQNDAVLMTRVHISDDHLGTRLGSSEDGLEVDRVDTKTLVVSRVEPPRKDASEYISDGHGNVRIMGVSRQNFAGRDKGIVSYYYRLQGSRDWKQMGDFNYADETGFNPYVIDYERNAVYGFQKVDGRQALYRMALDGTARLDLVLARPDVDVDGLITIGRRGRVVGASYATDIRHAVYFDPALQKLSVALGKALPKQPQVRVTEASVDENRLLVWAGSDTDPGQYFVYDRITHELMPFTGVRPPLANVPLATVTPVNYPAADGTMVPGYLTLPVGGSGKHLPAIVLPHGGPSARDEWGFDWLSQYYAARGFAVLQPNFRGSSGYGDAWFKDNGFKSWRTAIGDVNDAGKWLIAQGIADPKKLAIVGWSYGGYAALQAAVVNPGLFKAVVAVAPVTDLAALKQESLRWSDYNVVSDYIGDGPHIKEGSPAQNASAIKVPVLLFHAELDRNVAIGESRLMDAKLGAAGVSHELVTWPKLDHYLDDSDARATLLRKSDAFLRASMGM
jgi:dienelactone hydrolase